MKVGQVPTFFMLVWLVIFYLLSLGITLKKMYMTKDYTLQGFKVKTEMFREISDKNYSRLNRNLDVDTLLKCGYDELEVLEQIIHSHAGGQPCRNHFRMIMRTKGGDVVTQDIWLEQLRDLVDKVYEMVNP